MAFVIDIGGNEGYFSHVCIHPMILHFLDSNFDFSPIYLLPTFILFCLHLFAFPCMPTFILKNLIFIGLARD